MPQIQRITAFSQVEMLYRERLKKDFARNERRPLASLRRSWERGAYECYGLFEGEEILGYAFFVRLGKCFLLDYLAISEEHRDQGLGSHLLRQLAPRLKSAACVLVEVEDPDLAEDPESRTQRERRLQFYLRSGWRETALVARVFGADYRILELPCAEKHSPEELREIYTELYRSILPALFFRTQFSAALGENP